MDHTYSHQISWKIKINISPQDDDEESFQCTLIAALNHKEMNNPQRKRNFKTFCWSMNLGKIKFSAKLKDWTVKKN